MKLHLDADTSIRSLHRGLTAKGHDVTRTPNEWMPADATDAEQLLGATGHGRAIFTFNARDFLILADRYPAHGGIVLAAQRRWDIRSLSEALAALLDSHREETLAGHVAWLAR